MSVEPVGKFNATDVISFAKKVWVMIDFHDWKWISNFKRFSSEVTDIEVLNGLKEGEIEVNLG